jgi:hypothetical protein
MPTLAVIQASYPRCQVFEDRKCAAKFPCDAAISERCGMPLQWDHEGGQWLCPKHEAVLSGEEAAGWFAAA